MSRQVRREYFRAEPGSAGIGKRQCREGVEGGETVSHAAVLSRLLTEEEESGEGSEALFNKESRAGPGVKCDVTRYVNLVTSHLEIQDRKQVKA
jgi:hypothetical protein